MEITLRAGFPLINELNEEPCDLRPAIVLDRASRARWIVRHAEYANFHTGCAARVEVVYELD